MLGQRCNALIIGFLLGWITLQADAQTAKKIRPAKRVAKPSQGMSIQYSASSWNSNPSQIDTAYILMRDKTSGKIVQIQLEETEPDSGKFEGRFSISHNPGEKVMPEVFIPPQDIRTSDKDGKKFHELIHSGKLESKPIAFKEDDAGQTVLDVYDSKEAAQSAQSAYDVQKKLAREEKKKNLIKPIPSESSLETAKQAEHQKMLAQLAKEAALRAGDRAQLEQLERQKTDERITAMQALSESEKQARKERAKKLSEEAFGYYQKGDYTKAESLYRQAVEQDPQNNQFYYFYGVTLYRNSKFNEALVIMRIAKVDEKLTLEKKYYMGLIHYRLKELDPALENFKSVAKSGDPTLAPSADFYAGVIYFTKEQFEPAKKSFETVIDTSTDPRLDEQAESYLDQIANAMAYQNLRKNKFTFTGVVGGMYDSNVLLSPDNASGQGSTTDSADFRLLTSGDLEYRPIFKEHHELFAKGAASLTNSLKDESAIADPWVYTVSLPYSYKGVLGSKGLKFTVKPGYEILYMDPSNTGTKSNILSSYFVSFDATLIMNQNWFAMYTLEYRSDDSKTASSDGDDDADAAKYSLKTTQSLFLDKNKKEAIIGNAGLVMNAAKGKNVDYMRYDLGATYVKPTNWNASWLTSLSFYKLQYPDSDDSRSDFNTTVMTGFSKPIREWFTWGATASYTKNDSNVDDSEYNKYLIMTTATFVTNF